MANVICLGEMLVDFISAETDCEIGRTTKFQKAPGGAPANVAVGLARLGVKAGFIGKVGSDEFGKFLKSELERNKVDTHGMILDDEHLTTLAFAANKSDGSKNILFYRSPGADMMLESRELDEELFARSDCLHFGSVSLTENPARVATLTALEFAKKNDLFVSFDPNIRMTLWNNAREARKWIREASSFAKLVKLSGEEWEFLTDEVELEKGCEALLQPPTELVVVTLGGRGCYFTNGRQKGYVEGFDVTVKDTLGAGDAFMAALLARILKDGYADKLAGLDKKTLVEMMTYANAAGALAATKAGAIPALPTDAKIRGLIESSKR